MVKPHESVWRSSFLRKDPRAENGKVHPLGPGQHPGSTLETESLLAAGAQGDLSEGFEQAVRLTLVHPTANCTDLTNPY